MMELLHWLSDKCVGSNFYHYVMHAIHAQQHFLGIRILHGVSSPFKLNSHFDFKYLDGEGIHLLKSFQCSIIPLAAKLFMPPQLRPVATYLAFLIYSILSRVTPWASVDFSASSDIGHSSQSRFKYFMNRAQALGKCQVTDLRRSLRAIVCETHLWQWKWVSICFVKECYKSSQKAPPHTLSKIF